MSRKFDLTTDYLKLIEAVNIQLPEEIVIKKITQTLSQRYNKTVTAHLRVIYRDPHFPVGGRENANVAAATR